MFAADVVSALLYIELSQEIHIAVRPEITPSGRTDQLKRLDVVPAAEFSDFVTGQFEVRMDHGAAQLCWDILLLKV